MISSERCGVEGRYLNARSLYQTSVRKAGLRVVYSRCRMYETDGGMMSCTVYGFMVIETTKWGITKKD